MFVRKEIVERLRKGFLGLFYRYSHYFALRLYFVDLVQRNRDVLGFGNPQILIVRILRFDSDVVSRRVIPYRGTANARNVENIALFGNATKDRPFVSQVAEYAFPLTVCH